MTDPPEVNKRQELNFDRAGLFRLLSAHLYSSGKFALLRELIQNADDANVRRRGKDVSFKAGQERIDIDINIQDGVISITDNGIGMAVHDLDVLIQRLADSTDVLADRFLAASNDEDRDIIGRFGVGLGLLSALAICDRIKIISRRGGEDSGSVVAVIRQDDIRISVEGDQPQPGTTVSLYLLPDQRELLDKQAVEYLIKTECRYVKSSIFISGEAQPIHSAYRRPPSDRQSLPTNENSGVELTERISSILNNAGLAFDREPVVGGLRPDFLVYGPRGETVVLEVKPWADEPGSLSRALNQIAHYKRATGANSAFVVAAHHGTASSSSGVVPLAGLVEAINGEFRKLIPEQRSLKPVSGARPTVFAAMPFSADYDDVFFVAMAYAAENVGAACVRVDKEEFSGDIVSKLQGMIRESVALIADLSEARPNVLYETGFAHALAKPVVHICSTPLTDLPFDVRNWATLGYQRGRTHEFREKLRSRLASIIGSTA
jgi:hypothetical protein